MAQSRWRAVTDLHLPTPIAPAVLALAPVSAIILLSVETLMGLGLAMCGSLHGVGDCSAGRQLVGVVSGFAALLLIARCDYLLGVGCVSFIAVPSALCLLRCTGLVLIGIGAIVHSRPKEVGGFIDKCFRKQREMDKRGKGEQRAFAHAFGVDRTPCVTLMYHA